MRVIGKVLLGALTLIGIVGFGAVLNASDPSRYNDLQVAVIIAIACLCVGFVSYAIFVASTTTSKAAHVIFMVAAWLTTVVLLVAQTSGYIDGGGWLGVSTFLPMGFGSLSLLLATDKSRPPARQQLHW